MKAFTSLSKNFLNLKNPPNLQNKSLIRPLTNVSSSTNILKSDDDTKPKTVKPFSEVPGPFQLPFLGNVQLLPSYIFDQDKSNEILLKRIQKYGNIFKEQIGNVSMVYIHNPIDIETVYRNEGKYPRRIHIDSWRQWRDENNLPRGILTEDGHQWSVMRKILDKPMLKRDYVRSYFKEFDSVLDDFMARIEKISSQNDKHLVHHIDQELFHWSLESIGTVLYEKRLGGLSDPKPPQTSTFIKAVQNLFTSTGKLFFLPQYINKVLFRKWFNMHAKSWQDIFDISTEMIHAKLERIKESKKKNNIHNNNNNNNNNGDNNNGDNNNNGDGGGGFLAYLLETDMKEEEVVGSLSEIMLGAVDTTSTAVQWALYELSQNPEVQNRIIRELDGNLKDGCLRCYQDVESLSYLKAVIKETLRLYPLVTIASRILDKDIVLSGYQIPKNTTFMANIFLLCRDNRYYTDALKFLPERWLRKSSPLSTAASQVHNFTWLPFGFGPRGCIGRRISELEMYMLLAKLLKKYEIKCLNERKIEPLTIGFLTPSEPLKLAFVKR